MEPILSVTHLSYGYDVGDTVLHDVSFDVAVGSYLAIAGPNGSGKTTLAKIILGLNAPYKGTISLMGTPHKAFTDWHHIGYLPQHTDDIHPLFPATVFEVVRSGLISCKSFPKRYTKEDEEKVLDALARVSLEEQARTSIHALSGGQKQRTLLARAIVARPKLLILDEPSTALDPETRSHIFSFLQEEHSRGVTILMITHDTAHIGQYADTLLFLDRKVVYAGGFDGCCTDTSLRAYFGSDAAGEHLFNHPHHD